MKLRYDNEADAIYIELSSKPYAYGKDLDHERRIDYAANETPIGVELLGVSKGVNVTDLPSWKKLAALLANQGVVAYVLGQETEVSTTSHETMEVSTTSHETMEVSTTSHGVFEMFVTFSGWASEHSQVLKPTIQEPNRCAFDLTEALKEVVTV